MVIVPTQAHQVDANGVEYVTISPATTNQDLKFQGKFEDTFPASSLREAFQQHEAFRASSTSPRVSDADDGLPPSHEQVPENIAEEKQKEIVGLSEDLASYPVTTGAQEKAFALTSAPKGLISAIMTAYNNHCNLVISPDAVWVTILSQFCAYVNGNVEKLRSVIVAHEGKKSLELKIVGKPTTVDYPSIINIMLEKIKKNIKSPELAEWFLPGFSTTTERDRVAAAATAMASLQAYFEYKWHFVCGIPSVTLLGTVADWMLLRKKINRLLKFEVRDNPEGEVMKLWVGYLRKVCDGFVESAKNPGSAKTLEFWDKVTLSRLD